MKYLVTGGNRGLGLSIVDQLNADSISRNNGYDITKDHKKIAELSLNYDVFINNAFDGPPQEEWACFAQFNVLHAVYTAWKENNKQGLIVNIGSSGSKTIVAPEPSFETYRVAKATLEHASKQCTKAFRDNIVQFKTTLLTIDRLDTELSRSRATWTGNGLDCNLISDYIKFVANLPGNTCIEESAFYINYEYGKS